MKKRTVVGASNISFMNSDIKSKMVDKLSSKNSDSIIFSIMMGAIILLHKLCDGWWLFAAMLASYFLSLYVAFLEKIHKQKKYDQTPDEIIKHEYEELVEEEKSKKLTRQLNTWGIAALAIALAITLLSTNPNAASFKSYIEIETSNNTNYFEYKRMNFFLISIYKCDPSKNDKMYLGILNNFIDISWINDKEQ